MSLFDFCDIQDVTKEMDFVDIKRVRVGWIHVLNRLGVVLRELPNILIPTNRFISGNALYYLSTRTTNEVIS